MEVFGSVARGDAKLGSDVDVIIEFADPAYIPSLLELGEIEADLSDAAKIKVQIMTKDSHRHIVNPFLASTIDADRRELLKI